MVSLPPYITLVYDVFLKLYSQEMAGGVLTDFEGLLCYCLALVVGGFLTTSY